MFKNIYWQKGAVQLLFKGYDNYLILGEYYCLSTWLILLLSQFTNKKIYFWTHGWYGNENSFKKIIKKVFFKLSHGVFLYGSYAKGLMIKENFDSKKLHVIYNSLNYDKQLKVRNKLISSSVFAKHFKNDLPVVIFIGRLTKVKKLDYLLDVQFELGNDDFDLNVVFVGEGEEKKALQRKVNELGLKNKNHSFL